MWHQVEYVAESRMLDAAKLRTFAIENQDRYGIVIEGNRVEIGTWYVDVMVSDFTQRAAQKGESVEGCGQKSSG